jgi:hypothetical protein
VPCAAFGGLEADDEHVFLGSNTQSFLRYVQQELGAPNATEAALRRWTIEDLAKEAVGVRGWGWVGVYVCACLEIAVAAEASLAHAAFCSDCVT